MTPPDVDRLLRRLEREAVIFCVATAVAALLLSGGRLDIAGGVVGGGLLAAYSYWAIRSSIDGLMALAVGTGASPAEPSEDGHAPRPGASRRAARYVLRFTGRYVVLGLLAYVMLVTLRLHPVGLVIGVSSLVAAVTFEAVRWAVARR